MNENTQVVDARVVVPEVTFDENGFPNLPANLDLRAKNKDGEVVDVVYVQTDEEVGKAPEVN